MARADTAESFKTAAIAEVSRMWVVERWGA